MEGVFEVTTARQGDPARGHMLFAGFEEAQGLGNPALSLIVCGFGVDLGSATSTEILRCHSVCMIWELEVG